MILIPLLTPYLSSLWLGLVTPLYARVRRKLIDSIRSDTLVQDVGMKNYMLRNMLSQINLNLQRFVAVVYIALFCTGCSKTFETQDPLKQAFPSVRARILTDEQVIIPEFFKKKPTLLLVGYVQDTQFDIDRWILALKQLSTPINIAEIPAIRGFFPRMISSQINSGMRDGIPQEDWKIVFTVYADAEEVAKFFGNSKPRNARVVLLDNEGRVQWFHDQGFSADRAIELDNFIRETFSSSDQGESGSR